MVECIFLIVIGGLIRIILSPAYGSEFRFSTFLMHGLYRGFAW
jgi:hypothetical protein